MKRTKPDAGEPVTVTSEDRNVAMSVAYKLAVQDVTNDDQYRHEAAKIVALHRQQAVAEATADALRTIVELSDANIKAESSRDELAAMVVRMRDELVTAKQMAESDAHNLRLKGNYPGECQRRNDAERISLTLSLVPADLRDCVVIPRAEYERLKGGK